MISTSLIGWVLFDISGTYSCPYMIPHPPILLKHRVSSLELALAKGCSC